MNIPEELPQCTDTPTLIAVFGTTNGVCYRALNGELAQIADIHESIPKYSDREGFFMSSNPSGTAHSGSSYENPRGIAADAFSRHAASELDRLVVQEHAQAIILVVPQEETSRLLEHMSTRVRNLIQQTIPGNHVKSHPLDVLRLTRREGGSHQYPDRDK